MTGVPGAGRRAAALLWLVSGLGLGWLTSCGGSIDPATRAAYTRLRVDSAECRAPGPATVDPAAMRADWSELEHVLRRGYAGFTLAADEAEWAERFTRGRQGLPAAPVSALAFRDYLVEQLRFLDDNHLGFWVRGADRRRRWRSTSQHHFAHLSESRFRPRGDGWVDENGRPLEPCPGVEASVQPVGVQLAWSIGSSPFPQSPSSRCSAA